MGHDVQCRLKWLGPKSREALLDSTFPKSPHVYAIIVATRPHSLLRIGVSTDFRGRLRGYPVVDFIPNCQILYCAVPHHFVRDLEPVLSGYFADAKNPRPAHLSRKTPADCVKRELKSIQYKVERLLLEEYKKRHGILPPGNRMTGSARLYLDQVSVVENGPVRVLRMPRAALASMELSGKQLLRLLW
jgi:hypothetical protein